uniref:Uncharacterized protein n=1 Tax=Octactis speculum TaxID=3111310 RepID=A0A7S2FZ46_9STRA|mmetsp:Transcript_33230/g.44969  ORF Transcript_33230/g.44969 Transcript_33230/m.44969 type:complete len:239 (+) Transcript_33230:550-1266(+)
MIKARIDLNMLLFDPVPGDLVWTGFPFTGYGHTDLSRCTPFLKRILAIYPHEPLPDLSFHAPVLCKYPKGCYVEEDVTLGCHQGALFMTRRVPREEGNRNSIDLASNLSFRRIHDWLTDVGTTLDVNRVLIRGFYNPDAQACIGLMKAACRTHLPTRRILHDATAASGRVIIRRGADCNARFLNKHHEALERRMGTYHDSCDEFDITERPEFETRYLLEIVTPESSASWFCRPVSRSG